jgi:hypothetical protein
MVFFLEWRITYNPKIYGSQVSVCGGQEGPERHKQLINSQEEASG